MAKPVHRTLADAPVVVGIRRFPLAPALPANPDESKGGGLRRSSPGSQADALGDVQRQHLRRKAVVVVAGTKMQLADRSHRSTPRSRKVVSPARAGSRGRARRSTSSRPDRRASPPGTRRAPARTSATGYRHARSARRARPADRGCGVRTTGCPAQDSAPAMYSSDMMTRWFTVSTARGWGLGCGRVRRTDSSRKAGPPEQAPSRGMCAVGFSPMANASGYAGVPPACSVSRALRPFLGRAGETPAYPGRGAQGRPANHPSSG